MRIINRNVSIVVVLLVLVVIAGYLVWLRSKVNPPVVTPTVEVQVTPTPFPTATATASPSATPAATEATGSVRLKTAAPGATRR